MEGKRICALPAVDEQLLVGGRGDRICERAQGSCVLHGAGFSKRTQHSCVKFRFFLRRFIATTVGDCFEKPGSGIECQAQFAGGPGVTMNAAATRFGG